MKKNNVLRSVIFSFLFAFVCLMSVVPTNATSITNESGFYLLTDSTPEDAIEYAKNNVYAFLIARSEVDYFDLSSVTMGNPFTMGKGSENDDDVFYFPLYSNGEIIYTFRVYYDEYIEEYTGILSYYMVEPLNKYKTSTSKENPLAIYIDNGNIMANLNGNVKVLEKDHFGNEPNNKIKILENVTEADIVDITDLIDFRIDKSSICFCF